MTLNILKLIKKFNMEDTHPNMWVSLRVVLTMPVCITSGERFSKLIENNLRSSMSQERSSSVATPSIENIVT
jgi:hypothetical protein